MRRHRPSVGIRPVRQHYASPLPGDRDRATGGPDSALLARGVSVGRIAWDPGIGFGKTVEQNFALLARQEELLAAGYPLVVGWSRKSSLGAVTGLPVNERLAPSVAAALLAVERGAQVVRVHDVKETLAALKVRSATLAMANNRGMEPKA